MSLTRRERWQRMTNARATLAQLALLRDADTIAEWLRLQGIRGRRNSECDCPVAVLLRQQTGAGRARVTPTQADLYAHELPVRLPEPVAAFVQYFDSGRYPRLVR